MVAKIDLTGEVYGEWTVLSAAPSIQYGTQSRTAWNCRCSCGREFVVLSGHLRSGRSKRCIECRNLLSYGVTNPGWKGGQYVSMSYFLHLQNNAVRRSRTLPFELTIPYIEDLLIAQEFRCIYTGWELRFVSGDKHHNITGTASLDRIDSAEGYVEGNVQWVHKWVNVAKSDLSHEDFLAMCFAIASGGG